MRSGGPTAANANMALWVWPTDRLAAERALVKTSVKLGTARCLAVTPLWILVQELCRLQDPSARDRLRQQRLQAERRPSGMAASTVSDLQSLKQWIGRRLR